MKRFIICIFAAILLCGASLGQTADYSRKMIESQGRAWTAEKSWDYVPGLVAEAVLKAYEQYSEEEWAGTAYSWSKAFADNSIGSNGMFNNDGSFNRFKKGSIDEVASGKVFFELYREEMKNGNTGVAKKYKACAETLYRYFTTEYSRIEKEVGRGGYWHKNSYPNQMWLDGLFMGPAFCAEYLANFASDDVEGWKDIALQFNIIHGHSYDRIKKLNYHGWSADPADGNSFWANRDQESDNYGCSSEFWGRGMGWYFAALVDVIEFFPAELSERDELIAIVNEVAEGLAARQDAETGAWYQLLQYDGTFSIERNGTKKSNYVEASASCMFTYGFLKALRLQIIDGNRYEAVAEKAYDGLIKTFITESNGKVSIKGICRSAGLGPSNKPERDGSAYYYLFGSDAKDIVSNEGKGIGAFILASLEYEKAVAVRSSIQDVEQEERCTRGGLYGIDGKVVRNRHDGIVIEGGRKLRWLK